MVRKATATCSAVSHGRRLAPASPLAARLPRGSQPNARGQSGPSARPRAPRRGKPGTPARGNFWKRRHSLSLKFTRSGLSFLHLRTNQKPDFRVGRAAPSLGPFGAAARPEVEVAGGGRSREQAARGRRAPSRRKPARPGLAEGPRSGHAVAQGRASSVGTKGRET